MGSLCRHPSSSLHTLCFLVHNQVHECLFCLAPSPPSGMPGSEHSKHGSNCTSHTISTCCFCCLQGASTSEQQLQQVLSDLTSSLQQPGAATSSEPACTSSNGQQLQLPPVASTQGPVHLCYSSDRDPAAAAAQVAAAAAAAAAMNADAGNADGYAMVRACWWVVP
jgi:hypothetical protein